MPDNLTGDNQLATPGRRGRQQSRWDAARPTSRLGPQARAGFRRSTIDSRLPSLGSLLGQAGQPDA